MSQIAKLFDGSSASDLETLTADTGGAVGVDSSFNIDILGGTGISTVGDPALHKITISKKNSVEGTATTVGAVNADVITLPLGTVAGTYFFSGEITAYDTTLSRGGSYIFAGSIRTNGAVATEVSNQNSFESTDVSMIPADFDLIANANNSIVRVLGVAGSTINWKCSLYYLFIS